MKLTKIGIIGQQCAGKTTAAKFVGELFDTIVVVKFADPIYGTLKALRKEKNRAFMQEFGDFAKKHFGELIFVENFIYSVKKIQAQFENERPNVRENLIICDDIRRTYEYDAAKELDFNLISIDAIANIRKQRAETKGLDFIETHNSETEIPALIYKSDYVIIDQGITKDKLRKYIRAGVKQFTLLEVKDLKG